MIADADPDNPIAPPSEKTSPPSAPGDATARVNALAEKLRKEGDEVARKEAEESAKRKERINSQKKLAQGRGGIITPDQAELIRTYKSGTEVRMTGTARQIRTSGSTKSIYIDFTGPENVRLTGVIAEERDFKDTHEVSSFEKFVGKQLTLSGKVFGDSTGSRYLKITSFDQITVGE